MFESEVTAGRRVSEILKVRFECEKFGGLCYVCTFSGFIEARVPKFEYEIESFAFGVLNSGCEGPYLIKNLIESETVMSLNPSKVCDLTDKFGNLFSGHEVSELNQGSVLQDVRSLNPLSIYVLYIESLVSGSVFKGVYIECEFSELLDSVFQELILSGIVNILWPLNQMTDRCRLLLLPLLVLLVCSFRADLVPLL
ncbi:hypothetical protein MG293_005682 [Ovis ammon polii]|uniref:Uncharacterized protein n=1 Tax=Ovis ammon polii TaxID=230172 RepID=A0AAD4UHL6_OVIAM|nr:hypothetical protein MG293_005682 [Ovis ammon polii]